MNQLIIAIWLEAQYQTLWDYGITLDKKAFVSDPENMVDMVTAITVMSEGGDYYVCGR